MISNPVSVPDCTQSDETSTDPAAQLEKIEKIGSAVVPLIPARLTDIVASIANASVVTE